MNLRSPYLFPASLFFIGVLGYWLFDGWAPNSVPVRVSQFFCGFGVLAALYTYGRKRQQ